MLTIHARRHGPTADWKVVVSYENGTCSFFDRIEIDGRCAIESKQGGESPHVYMVPDPSAKVVAYDGTKSYQLQ